MSEQVYKLSDEFIAQIAKIIQVAMLTGTNIVDNLRLVRVSGTDGEVVLTSEYKEYFEGSIAKMLEEAEDIKEEMRNTIAQA